GHGGGQLLITGTPEEVVQSKVGYTAEFLALEMSASLASAQ
ncbi:MAG: excinuclease UvrABC ATPase subunit, partial [Pseudoalteromonas distincta]